MIMNVSHGTNIGYEDPNAQVEGADESCSKEIGIEIRGCPSFNAAEAGTVISFDDKHIVIQGVGSSLESNAEREFRITRNPPCLGKGS